MRILQLTQFFPPELGGEQMHVLNLANTLAGRHDVAVATQCLPQVANREVLTSGVRVYRFPTMAMRVPGVYSSSRMWHPPVPDPIAVREVAKIIEHERPDVVHAHNWIVNSVVPLRHRIGHKFALVLTLHDFSHVCATKMFMRKGALCSGPSVRRCLPCVAANYGPVIGPATYAATVGMRWWKNRAIDHVVCVSNAVAAGNGVESSSNSSVIPNFVLDSVVCDRRDGTIGTLDDADQQLPAEPFLFYAGDLNNYKGVPVLLRAYSALPEPRPPLVLVGRRFADVTLSLPDGARMYFDWPHERVMAAFRCCLAAILPSTWPDACPTTVLEAMACGRPVVTSAIGGIVDMVIDGQSGLLTAPGDAGQLAAAIARVVGDAALRERLADGALSRVRLFTASATAGRLEAVYERVAPEHAGVSSSTRRWGKAGLP